jgi:hypothetical protein
LDLAENAAAIANSAMAKARAEHGDLYAREMATCFTAAWACALAGMVGDRSASMQIYALGDAIATGDRK